jgi:hypothetical protein
MLTDMLHDIRVPRDNNTQNPELFPTGIINVITYKSSRFQASASKYMRTVFFRAVTQHVPQHAVQ